MKLVNAMLDIFDDLGLDTFKKVAGSAPERLQKVPLMTFEQRAELDDSDFALQIITKEAGILNKYPVNDELNTWLSNAYFDAIGHILPYTAQKVAASNIKQACERFGIAPAKSVEKLASTTSLPNVYMEGQQEDYNQLLKEAAAEMERVPHVIESPHFYALPQLKKYAMPDQKHVTQAADYFSKYANYFDANERREYALEVVERAKELNVDISRFTKVAHYASNCYNGQIDAHLATRLSLLEDKPVFKEALLKMAAMRSNHDAVTFARALYEFDKMAGLTARYDTAVADAFFSTLGPEKIASGELEITGMIVKDKQLKDMSEKHAKKMEKYLGKTLTGSLKKAGISALGEMPDTTQEAVARIMNGLI